MKMTDEEMIDQMKASSKRECGKCSLCCRLLDVPEVNKPTHDWCQHALPGKGCAIYKDRPDVCKGYACLWLVVKQMPDYWKPLTSKMILDFSPSENRHPDLRIHLHPKFPNRWREPPYHDEILWLARAGLNGKGGPFPYPYQTVIMKEAERLFIVLSHKVIPWATGISLRMPDGSWEFVKTKTEADALTLHNKLNDLAEAAIEFHRKNPDATPAQRLRALATKLGVNV